MQQPVQNPDGSWTYTFDRGMKPTQPEFVPGPSASVGGSSGSNPLFIGILAALLLILGLFGLFASKRPAPRPPAVTPPTITIPETPSTPVS